MDLQQASSRARDIRASVKSEIANAKLRYEFEGVLPRTLAFHKYPYGAADGIRGR